MKSLKNASPERIDESYERIMKCKKQVGILASTAASAVLDFEKASILNKKIAANSLTKISG